MNHNGNHIESRLWAAADELRANSKLKSSEYSVPVLGLVFLRYADHKFQEAAKELTSAGGGGRRKIGPADYQARGVLYLPEPARFSALIALPEGANIGAAINEAMRAIEAENPDLKDVLPKTYNRFENALLNSLLKAMNSVPMDIEGDAFVDQVLFIDARHLYRQIDRAHRDWTPAQIEFLANIVWFYRGEKPENLHDSADLLAEHFPAGKYADVAGLCKVATLSEIESQGWSLNPGRYVGVAARAEEDFDFKERLEELNEELETLNAEARELEERIAENVTKLLEGE